MDKSLVEFKLARNSKLEKNLAHQVEIYERANQTKKALKVIVYFTREELAKVETPRLPARPRRGASESPRVVAELDCRGHKI